MNTKIMTFDKTIKKWDDGLPLGNGDLGCLVWNSPNKLRFSIDKAGIWDTGDSPEQNDYFNYDTIKKYVAEKNHKGLVEKFDKVYHKPLPTKLPTGKIIIDLKTKGNIKSTLDFERAEGVLTTGDIILKTFVSATENFGLIHINKANVSAKINNPKFGTKKKKLFDRIAMGTVQSLKNLQYDNAEFFTLPIDGGCIEYFVQKTSEQYYGIVMAKKVINNSTLIAYTVCMGDSKDCMNDGINIVKKVVLNSYEQNIQNHLEWWKNYWTKSKVILDDKFFEYEWNLGNYLLASTSRKGHFPMPLQGVWTADNDSLPPWKGDYHHDLNTQMSYTSYLKANHWQEGESFVDYLFSLQEVGKEFAKKFYGAKGMCVPSVMDITGHALGGWCMYSLSPTNQLWLAFIVARHYHFTKDKEYFKKAYEYLELVGEFILSILQEKDGFLKLPLSSSPEIFDNTLKAWRPANTNYDLALLKSFFAEMVEFNRIADNKEKEEQWQKLTEKLEALHVNQDNILMMDSEYTLDMSHRHHSHCMSIYPLKLLHYTDEADKKIIDATIARLESLGIRNWVGYSFGWIACLYALQGNGDKAYKNLSDFWHYFCTENGFHSNGDYKHAKRDCAIKCRLFTLEGNFLAVDALQEMLLYSEKDRTKLFPSMPSNIQNAEIIGFRGYNGIIIDAKYECGKLHSFCIKATCDVILNLDNECSDFKLNKNLDNKTIFLKEGEMLKTI